MKSRYFGGILFLIWGTLIARNPYSSHWGSPIVDLSPWYLYYPIVSFFIISGLLLIFSKPKPKEPITTKCPKCKETFNYKDTLNGKCPHCKDVDTIDVKEY